MHFEKTLVKTSSKLIHKMGLIVKTSWSKNVGNALCNDDGTWHQAIALIKYL